MIDFIIRLLLVLMDWLRENKNDNEALERAANYITTFFAFNGKFCHRVMIRLHLCGSEDESTDAYKYIGYHDVRRLTTIASIFKAYRPDSKYELTRVINIDWGSLEKTYHDTFEEAEAELLQWLRKLKYTYVGDINLNDEEENDCIQEAGSSN